MSSFAKFLQCMVVFVAVLTSCYTLSAQTDCASGRILLDNLSNTFTGTDAVIEEAHAFDYSSCDSICISMVVHTNGLSWIGSGNMEWHGECGFGADICAGDIENSTSGPCENCWDFLAAKLIMNDSVYYLNVLGDAEDDPDSTVWYSDIIKTPVGNLDSGRVVISAQTWANNESLSYEALTVFCHNVSTATDGQQALSEIRLFPNPASDILYIESDPGTNYKASIWDITGTLVTSSHHAKQIELTSLLSGTYLIVIDDLDDGHRVVEKILVDR